jgi:hypothetical protein
MANERCAALLSRFTQRPTRRGIALIAAGVASGGLLPRLRLLDADARKKKKKRCKGGKKKCGKKCVDLQTSTAHCGVCGNACAESEVCLDGVCGCAAGDKPCGDVCCTIGSCIDDACCPDTQTCGDTCCAAGQICADSIIGLCVVGQGTCPAGADSCDGNSVTCNSPETCGCFQSTSGATRCGKIAATAECGQCSIDADCETLLGEPGAFCVQDFSGSCLCEQGENVCGIPCPA